MNDELTLKYLLARTVVRINGTWSADTASGEHVTVRTGDVSLGVEGDHETGALSLVLDGHWWATRAFGLDLAADGRLTGASHESEGLGGQLIGAGVSLITTVGKLVGTRGLVELPAPSPEPIDDVFERAKPDLAKRRTTYGRLVLDLQSRLATLASQAATGPDPIPPELSDQVKTVQLALSAARNEAGLIESRFEAWRARTYPTWTTKLTYVIGTEHLPSYDSAAPSILVTPGDLTPSAAEAMQSVGILVVRLDEDEDPHTARDPGDAEIQYRIPKRTRLAVYEVEDAEVAEGEPAATSVKLLLRSVTPAWVIDQLSEHAVVPLTSGFFSEHGTAVSFGASGTLSKITNKESSGIPGAISGLTGHVTGGLEAAGKIAADFPGPVDSSLKALEDEVDRKELQAKLVTANKIIAGAAEGS